MKLLSWLSHPIDRARAALYNSQERENARATRWPAYGEVAIIFGHSRLWLLRDWCRPSAVYVAWKVLLCVFVMDNSDRKRRREVDFEQKERIRSKVDCKSLNHVSVDASALFMFHGWHLCLSLQKVAVPLPFRTWGKDDCDELVRGLFCFGWYCSEGRVR